MNNFAGIPIYIPLVNPNEPEAILADLVVKQGQKVVRDERIATFETTKATLDLFAEQDGYVTGLCYQSGQTVRAGDLFCYLSPDPNYIPKEIQVNDGNLPTSDRGYPSGLKITKPALALANKAGLALESLPTGEWVTLKLIESILSPQKQLGSLLSEYLVGDNAVVIYGGGGHGKTLIELMKSQDQYNIVGIIDDGKPAGNMILGVPVLGNQSILTELKNVGIHQAINAVGGIGDSEIRINVFQKLQDHGFSFPKVIHPTAYIEPSAQLSDGVQVFSHAYIGSETKVGFGTIINTGAIISHDCVLGDFSNISPGAILAGEVQIGHAALVGMGVTVNLQVIIGNRSRIGNGATIKNNVPDHKIVKAGSIW